VIKGKREPLPQIPGDPKRQAVRVPADWCGGRLPGPDWCGGAMTPRDWCLPAGAASGRRTGPGERPRSGKN